MGKDVPGQDTPEMRALIKAVAEARQAFEAAEAALGGPVRLKTKTRMKADGEFVVKWTFKRVK